MARPCRERVDKFKNTLEKSTEVLASKVAETAGSLKSRAAPLAERAKESADFFAEFDFLEPTRRPAARKGLPQPVAAETECGPALPQLTDQTPGSATAAAAEAEAEAEADGAGQPGALAMPAGGTDAEAAAQGVDQGGGRACAAETDAPGSHAKAADALADETGETGLGPGGAPAVDGAGGERLAALGGDAPPARNDAVGEGDAAAGGEEAGGGPHGRMAPRAAAGVAGPTSQRSGASSPRSRRRPPRPRRGQWRQRGWRSS